MMIPKPELRKVVKARAGRVQQRSRRQCVEIVWRREHSRCERCGRTVLRKTECYPWQDEAGHVNELIPKSRGGDPTDPANCELVCRACHFGGPSGAHAPRKERMVTR
jgi:5-methylcytosine-specific restriction endonuclease McrA